MKNDFLTYLAIEHIQRFTTPTRPRSETDLERQSFDTFIFGTNSFEHEDVPYMTEAESQLLQNYLLLRHEDFFLLTSETHAWFFERLCIASDVISTEDVPRLVETYFLLGGGMLRYLTVKVLLTVEQAESEGGTGDEQTHVAEIWEEILSNQKLSLNHKALLIEEIADILLDINSSQARHALGILVQREKKIDW